MVKKFFYATIDSEVLDFLEDKRKKGYTKSGLANTILKKSKEYKDWERRNLNL